MGDFRKSWAAACKKAGKPGLLFHDLRRSAVRAMIQARVPMPVAMMISGHTTQSMFLRYGIRVQDDQRAAFEAVEKYHAEQAKQAEASNVVSMR